VQCLADELVGYAGPVELRSVDVIHTELDGSAQHRQCLDAITRRTKDPMTRQLHGAKAHAVHSLWAKKERVANSHFGRLPGSV